MDEIETIAVLDSIRFITLPADRRAKMCEALKIAMQALREKQERENRRAQPENEPRTCGDRIRAMSNEELAEWLVDATICERVCEEDEYCHGNECVKRVTDWLRQPAKEDSDA